MEATTLHQHIEVTELRIKISINKELSHYEIDTIYDRIDEIIEFSYYAHTNFVAELPVELINTPNAINEKINEINLKIESIISDIEKESKTAFTNVVNNIDKINEEAKKIGDVAQIIEFDYLPENVLLTWEDEDETAGSLNKCLIHIDNEEDMPLGWIMVDEDTDQVTEIHASF